MNRAIQPVSANPLQIPDERFYRAVITERVDLAADLWKVRIRPGGEFSFLPGQFATLGVEHNGKRLERPYSIVSSPHEAELEFFLELVPAGVLTPHLYKLQPGDELLMRKIAKGKFSLDFEKGKTNHLLISTVTGVAPFVSYARKLAKDWREGRFDGSHKLFLLNGASHPWEFGYREELSALQEELPWLKYVATVSRPWDHGEWSGETGRVNELLEKYLDVWELGAANTMAYLCGHPAMVEHSKQILKGRGFVEKGAVKEETYWIPPHV